MGQVSWSEGARLFIALSLLAIGFSCGASGDDPVEARCTPACATGFMCCPGTAAAPPACRNTQTDLANCGGCGIVCPAGQLCMAGGCRALDMGVLPDVGPRPDMGVPPPPPVDGGGGPCMPMCTSDQQCCGGTCSNRVAPAGTTDGRGDTSFRNCGRCGNACDPMKSSRCGMLPGGTGPQCMCGTSTACAGAQVCSLEGASYRCVDSSTDRLHCGTPPVACAEGETCRSGMCVCGSTGTRCAAGQACCSGMCVDVSSDRMNCGSCGSSCNAATASACSGGHCVCGSTGRECTRSTPGGELGELCCGSGASATCRMADNANCEACGSGCMDGQECQVGLTGGSCCGDPGEWLLLCENAGDAGDASM